MTFDFQRCFQQSISRIQLNRKDWNGMGYISFWSIPILIIYWTKTHVT